MKVKVVPHDPEWRAAYDREADAISAALGDCPVTLHHIGSTSIPDILAKPIIDILGEAADLSLIDARTPAFAGLGYQAKGEFGIAGRRYFKKDNAQGVRTHHIHFFQTGSPGAERHLAFRDYLRAYPEIAAEYSALKAEITRGGVNIDDYMDAKDPFIKRTERQAIDWFRAKRRG